MKTNKKLSYLRLALLFIGLQIFTEATAQAVEVKISVENDNGTATVAGNFSQDFRPSNALSLGFVREVAGNPDLASRIRDLQLRTDSGSLVEIRELQKGEYVATAAYTHWSNAVVFGRPRSRAAYAHASWMSETGGMLMLDDLIPQFGTKNGKLPATIRLMLPDGWTASFAGNRAEGNAFFSEDLKDSVIFIGKGLSPINLKAAYGDLDLLISGEWHFTNEEASDMAREIFDEYSQMLGKLPAKPYLVAIQRFPSNEPPGHWEAETRGQTVTILSSDMPFRTQSLQRLHEQLRHEIFHLWFPNGIDLNGDYAWFYEGFAMYSALKLGVKLSRIRFDDYLDTLGRAYTIDANAIPRRALTDGAVDPTVRYARGMLIALMTDLEALRDSRGRNDVSEMLRKLFVEHPKLQHGWDAVDAVKTVVTNPAYHKRYVDGSETIDWAAELAVAGIEARKSGRVTALAVAPKPNRRQKAILNRLGYNNWRKIGNRK